MTPTRTTRLVAALVLAAIAASGGPLSAQARIRIKLATLAPRDTSYHRILLEMADKWRKATAGQVDLVIYPGGTQGSEADSVKRMNIGQLQAGMLSVGGLTEIDPAVAALQEIPMLFRSLAEEEYVRDQLRPDLEKRLLAKGYVALFWADSGWVRFFTRSAATRPADFKNLKIFVTASNSATELQLMQALGYKPVALDWADVLIQMQTGGVDAVPTVPILALSGQYYTIAKHMTALNWLPLVGATVITKQAWDGVPPAMRPVLLEAAADAGRKIQDASRRENEEAVETMKTKLNVTVHAVSGQPEEEWRSLAESIYPKIRGPMVPADMFDQARRLVDEYRTAHPGTK
jgi:TRAP-type transport system periplasmic protein